MRVRASKRQRVVTEELDCAAAAGPAPEAAAAGVDEAALAATLGEAYDEVERLRAQPDPKPRCACPLLVGPMTVQERPGRGRGWVATADIPAGRTVLCESPLVASMDWEADALESEAPNFDSAALTIALAKQLAAKPHLAKRLRTLAPLAGQPTKPWECEDAALKAKVEEALGAVPNLDEDERERLKHVVRANSLGIYSNSEREPRSLALPCSCPHHRPRRPS